MAGHWKDGYTNVAITLPSGVQPFITSWRLRLQVPTFETSNIVRKKYEFGTGMPRYDLSGSYMIDEDDVREVDHFAVGAASFTDGSRTVTGDYIITSEERTGNTQGGVTVSFEGTFTDATVT